jgi:hypothetical protein
MTRPHPSLFLLSSLFAALLGGCSDEAPAMTPADAGPPGPPRFEELKPGAINVIKPGGKTICSRGTEYAFYVVPGARDKVIIEFEGGGACWDERSCAYASSLFKEKVDIEKHMTQLSTLAGWYDHAHPDHPMKDWTHVFIPYCTGDVHWGDNVKTYPAMEMPITINHKGAVNATAVLDWVYAQLPAPAKLFVTGCSAGGYGSILWAPHVQKHYPAAKVYHFSDSAAGVITTDFFEKSFPAWNVQPNFPSFVADFATVRSLAALYKAAAAHFPGNVFSQYNTALDANQTFYFVAMGGKDNKDWSTQMKASIKDIQAAAPGFRAFLAPGEQHCILPQANFYQSEAGGVKLAEWLGRMVNDQPIQSTYCSDCAP